MTDKFNWDPDGPVKMTITRQSDNGPRGRPNYEKTGLPGWHKMRSKYDGKCQQCEDLIAAGEWIAWKKSLGAYHLGCKPP